MYQVELTNSGILAFATTVALIVPLFIIAILVDSSKNAQQIGPIDTDKPADKASVRQSRRTLLAIGIGVLVEANSLNAIVTEPGDSATLAAPIGYSFVIINAVGLLTLFYIIFIPHIELHMSNIRKDPATARWSIIVGWLVDVGLVVSAANALFIGRSQFNHSIGYVFFGLSLIFTGSMIAFTIITIIRGRLKMHPAAEQRNDNSSPTRSNPL